AVFAGIVPALNFPAVRPYDAVTNTQSQSGTFSRRFGGVERIENLFHASDARAVVGDRDFDTVSNAQSFEPDYASAAGFFDCVIRVVENVEKDLLQLLSVAHYGRKVFLVFLDNLDSVADQVVAAQFSGLAKNCPNLNVFPLDRALSGKAE